MKAIIDENGFITPYDKIVCVRENDKYYSLYNTLGQKTECSKLEGDKFIKYLKKINQ